ncbi:hypothetical protein Pcinc_014026 [Petrolisthes cinctipes]|uniref:Uncharacterized protein n=1 Tax=Petrolisthes cinctipes TaxID=88211 RepID=A0AAE1KTN5_PETCI|nr:hypothetical protein Pcinc_014026 [Petrolisthes cinctipes]
MIIIPNLSITIIMSEPFNESPDGRPENKDALGNVTWNLFPLWCPLVAPQIRSPSLSLPWGPGLSLLYPRPPSEIRQLRATLNLTYVN